MKSATFRHLAGAVIVIFFVLWIISCKQEQCPLNTNYSNNLEQTDAEYSSWSAPVNLGPSINTQYVEQGAFLSKDRLNLYICSNRPGTIGDMDIWVSERQNENDPWGPPKNLGPTVNSSALDISPCLSNDGHWMYFASSRAGGCGGNDLYVAHRHDNRNNLAWETAINLGCIINGPFNDGSPDIYEDEALGVVTIYFESNRTGGQGESDMWTSILQPDGIFGPAVLVPNVSSQVTDGRPTIRTRDGLEMILASMRTGAVGLSDLWVTIRTTTFEPWQIPVNLGTTVNSAFNEGLPNLSFDGLTLIFNSNRPGGFGLGDLYMCTRTKLHGNGN